jgi:thioredoxin-related protein
VRNDYFIKNVCVFNEGKQGNAVCFEKGGVVKSIKKIILAGVIAFMLTGCSGNEKAGSSDSWVSIEEGLALAKKENKPIVIDFYTSWCKWCKVMEERTFSDANIAQYLKDNYICVRVNAEDRKTTFEYQDNKYTPFTLTRRLGVRGYPSLGYLNSDGGLIRIVPGFIPPETYIKVLKYFKEEYYKKNVSLKSFIEA